MSSTEWSYGNRNCKHQGKAAWVPHVGAATVTEAAPRRNAALSAGVGLLRRRFWVAGLSAPTWEK